MPHALGPLHLRILGVGVRQWARIFKEAREHEAPLNVYGYSKFLFDQAVRRVLAGDPKSQVAGFRYFNVYGPREAHKGRMASVAFHFFNQYLAEGRVRLFEGSAGYGPGEQVRDFVSVEDVVRVNLFFLDHPHVSGVFNVGTGQAQTFNDVARATVNAIRQSRGEKAMTLDEMRNAKAIEYIAFPQQLVGKYQSYTQADVDALRAAGYGEKFLNVDEGVGRYVSGVPRSPRPSMRIHRSPLSSSTRRILRVGNCRSSPHRRSPRAPLPPFSLWKMQASKPNPSKGKTARPAGAAPCTPIPTRSALHPWKLARVVARAAIASRRSARSRGPT